MNDDTIIYEINGDEIQYYDPNDPEIYPIPSPEPHYHPHLNPHSEPYINNNHNNEPHSFLDMNSMLGIYLFLSVTGIVLIGLYISRCIDEHRESIRIIRRNNMGTRQRINVNSLNTLLLCDELPDDSCSICLEDFKTGDNIKKLNCTHIFHKECLEPWLNNNSNCPMCRTDII